MCGIFFWANTHGNVDALLSAKALLSLHHRGPDYQEIVFNDGEKIYTDDSVNTLAAKAKKHAGPIYYVAGHARLSIIDLSPHGNQPMIGPAGEVFCFNGTLYNYIELRKRLHDEGITVASSSDTEVFLNWLCQYGVDQGNEFNGSWAFIFIDGKRGKLTLSRDPYGEKPLYYYKDEENLIVASEIKAIYIALGAIPQRFDPVKLSAFLAYQDWDSTDPSKTIFSDIRKVIPGINLSVDLKTLAITRGDTNTLAEKFTSPPNPDDIAADMRHEVDIRLRADVPIGVFLSGGVDSSMIAAMIKERARDGQDITFYTARYPDGVSSDYPFAQKVAKDIGISLRSIDITFDEHALENFKTLSRHYDQPVPFAGSTISENVLLKSMADDGIRVAISGMGGDEVFGGYGNEYIEGAMHDMLSKNSLIDTAVFARQVVRSRLTTVPALALFALNRLRGKRRDNSSFRGLLQFIRPQYRDMVETISQNYWAREAFHSPMHKVQITDCIEGRLANYVVFSDTNSMMNSIETRSPFLGPTLTKYMALPPTDKYRDGFNKHALRRAMPASIDSSVTWRKQKQGFTFSFGKFYQMNKPAIHGIVKANTVLNQLIEIDSFLVALEGHPIEQKMSLALLSVAVYCESHECVL